ncbi:SHOCT domain-containing protein [Nitrincola alkalisediminis]|uniref:SHOCT domain-containing protein n=1 Tax=Nitrincola alkalisediminis TaxID=1366656 RepID=UPI0018738ADA|nr:SHOCT domain-containing protein [Nitrincola alkalisediminis]
MNTAEKFKFIYENHAMDDLIQRCSGNLEIATLGGKLWWRDLAVVGGWKLQQNNLTSHVRILNPSDIRKAWGSRKALDDAMGLVVSQIRSQKFVADHNQEPLVARVKKLKLLLDKELITPEEFEARRAKILDEV